MAFFRQDAVDRTRQADETPLGVPAVPKGLALCKLHQSGCDVQRIGIRPDYIIEVRRDVLEEEDGPMLIGRLQGFQRASLVVPRRQTSQPDRLLLEERYARFRRLAGYAG